MDARHNTHEKFQRQLDGLKCELALLTAQLNTASEIFKADAQRLTEQAANYNR